MTANNQMKTAAIIEKPANAAQKSSDAEAVLCIWLVDDDAYCCEHLTWRLNAEPNVDCSRFFSSASSLLAALRQESPPAAILLDVQMPVMNGMEVIRSIKNLAPSAILLMLSTFFDHHLKEQALAAGAADFLLKRDSPAQIIAAIRATSAQFSSSHRTHVLAPQQLG
jgi:DNA-binding NarL/FixJ family response regulator